MEALFSPAWAACTDGGWGPLNPFNPPRPPPPLQKKCSRVLSNAAESATSDAQTGSLRSQQKWLPSQSTPNPQSGFFSVTPPQGQSNTLHTHPRLKKIKYSTPNSQQILIIIKSDSYCLTNTWYQRCVNPDEQQKKKQKRRDGIQHVCRNQTSQRSLTILMWVRIKDEKMYIGFHKN